MSESYLAPILHRMQHRSRFCSADDVIESVRSNIESLLNTRLSLPGDYVLRPTDRDSLKLLNESLINFGVVDFQSLNMGDPKMEKRFCKSVKMSIERYEPRLANVQVEISGSAPDRLINTKVKGQLVVKPFEEIRFESGLDIAAQSFVVS